MGLTVLDRQGLEQTEQMRLRTGSVDSEKLEWEVSSACSCASSTVLNRAPQSPHLRETPAIDSDAANAMQVTNFNNWISILTNQQHLRRLLGLAFSGRVAMQQRR